MTENEIFITPDFMCYLVRLT